MPASSKRIFTAVLAMVGTGCGGKSTVWFEGVRDSAGVVIAEHRHEDREALPVIATGDPLVRIGDGRSGPMNEFGQVAKGLFGPGGTIVVADRVQFRIVKFDSTGHFHAAIGREGEGPGEFVNIATLDRFDADSLILYDWTLRRFSILTDSLELARTVRPDLSRSPGACGPVGPVPGGYMFSCIPLESYTEEPGLQSMPYVLLRYHFATHQLIETGESFPADQFNFAHGSLPPLMGSVPFYFVYDSGYGTSWSDYYEFRLYEQGGVLSRIVRDELPQRPVQPAIIEAARLLNESRLGDFAARSEFLRAYERMPAPDAMPTFGRAGGTDKMALVDDQERLWVLEYDYDYFAAQRWIVHDESGIPSLIIELPPRATLLDVRRGQMLLRIKDEYDVEHVEVYADVSTVSEVRASR